MNTSDEAELFQESVFEKLSKHSKKKIDEKHSARCNGCSFIALDSENWKPIEEVRDDDKIYRGALVRLYNTDKALAECSALPIEPCDYVISEVSGDDEHFQLTCLSPGKEGANGGVLKMQESHIIFGAELKRVLVSDLYKVLINFNPQITIDGL